MTFDKEFYAAWKENHEHKVNSLLVANFARSCGLVFDRQYNSERKASPILRISSLGKTSFVEALGKKFGLIQQGDDSGISEQCRFRFLTGDMFEPMFEALLLLYGFEIIQTQTEVNWQGISGHIDYVVRTPEGEEALLELKTANEYYYKSCMQGTVGDERGYLTQLLLYQEAIGVPAYWVFLNKNDQSIGVKPLESVAEHSRIKAKQRAEQFLDVYEKCERFEDYPLYCLPPPPKVEVYKDGEIKLWEDLTPKLYIPQGYLKNPELFYKIKVEKIYGKERNYVIGWNYPDPSKAKDGHKTYPDLIEYALRHA